MRATLVIVAALLPGCGHMAAEEFDHELVDSLCELYIECEPDADDFETQEECTDSFDELLDSKELSRDHCAYDERAARQCIKALGRMSCDALYDESVFPGECDEVYTDCDN